MSHQISIIIPVYNVESYLSKCLDSVLCQTYKNIEIICINDGSTDNSLDILNEYALKDNRIKIINQKNSGVSSARNSGLEIAKGDFIRFLDSDDYLPSNACSELINAALINDADIVIANTEYISINGLTLKKTIYQTGIYDLNGELGCKAVIEKAPLVGMPWTFFKHTTISSIRFKSFTHGEDSLFYVDALMNSNKVVIIDSVLHYYLQRNDSAMSNVSCDSIKSHFLTGALCLDTMLKCPRFSKFKFQLIRLIQAHCYQFYYQLDKVHSFNCKLNNGFNKSVWHARFDELLNSYVYQCFNIKYFRRAIVHILKYTLILVFKTRMLISGR